MLRAALSSEAEGGFFTGTTDVACPGGGEIVAKAKLGATTFCTIRIPPQTGLKTLWAFPMPEHTPDDFTLKSELKSVKATVEKTSPFCPMTAGSYTNAEFAGSTLVAAKGTGEGTPPLDAGPKNVEHFQFELEKSGKVEIISQSLFAQKLNFGVATVECGSLLVKEKIDQEAKVLPEVLMGAGAYEECNRSNPAEKAEVVFNDGCHLWLDGGTFDKGTPVSGLSLLCTGDRVEVKVDGCTIKLPPQNGVKSQGIRRAALSNKGAGSGREISVALNLTGIEYEEVGASCADPGVKQKDGTLSGQMIVKAFEQGGKQIGVWVQKKP